MKFANKILALILATTMAFGGCVVASAAEDVDYAINNPYETVDFDNWGQYKADLHCHTTASDGDNTLTEMVEEHYAQGYDALAITDHGIVSRNWTTVNSRNYLKIGLGIKSGAISQISPLTEERYNEITIISKPAVDVSVIERCRILLNSHRNFNHRSAVTISARCNFLISFFCQWIDFRNCTVLNS